MRNLNNIVVVLGSLFLGGLIFWQIWQLNNFQTQSAALEVQEMENILLASAVEYRKMEVRDKDLIEDTVKKKLVLDTIISSNFKKFNRKIHWGLFDGTGKQRLSHDLSKHDNQLATASIKKCLSCLVSVDILEVDSINPKGKGFMLDHPPAQMRDMRGMEAENLRYLHIYPVPLNFSFTPFILPAMLLLGIVLSFIWLIFFSKKQARLVKQKNEFVNHLSHQFQTPLSSIKLSANLLANNSQNNSAELIQIIQTESNRLENHIKTVLHWVKSDADRLQILKDKVILTQLIEKALRQMKPVFLKNSTKVNFIPPEEELIINADEKHIQLMLFNVWENAIKHNNPKITLDIKCYKNEDQVIISTIDDGKGIVNNTSDIKFKGLGLAYINRIMQEHTGSMELITDTKKGLIVNLKFPTYD